MKHKKLEVGSTLLHPSYWGTAINPECKLLLLTYCFEVLQAVRVQLKTDENNIRSRKAIEKIYSIIKDPYRYTAQVSPAMAGTMMLHTSTSLSAS